jgi:pyrroline-5-carboxylate reductase
MGRGLEERKVNRVSLLEGKIGVIGSGTMAGAIVHALLDRAGVEPGQIMTSDPHGTQRERMRKLYGVTVTLDNVEAASGADVVILAVKPQVLPDVMVDLQGCIEPGALVFSIVAGTPLATICAGLSHEAVVRTMPNTPAQIGEGMTVWTASSAVTERQRAQARTILEAMGKALYVSGEDALDMATAVSGTGPTYVFLLMEALVDAAVHLGFSRRDARELVLQTVLGSVRFAYQTDLHLAQMRNMVTSPGGTSAEAIYQLEKGGMRTVLSKAVWAAYQKSRLLGTRAAEPVDAPLQVDSDRGSG